MNECTARRLCANEPLAHTGCAPTDDLDDTDRTNHPAGGAFVPAFVVAGSVAEVDVGAVDVSSRLGRAAFAGLRRGPKGSLSVDVLQCSRCQGKMRLITCIEEPDVARKILEHLGLPSEPLPTARAQAPPVTLELFPEA
jgi:hypothetical protein